MDFIFCWILISNLTTNNYMPPDIEERLHICSNIISYSPEEYGPELALAIGWQESGYTDAKGRWICTRKGKLVKTKAGTHRCVKTERSTKTPKLVRAEGPMQILKLYHCKKNPKSCDTTKAGVDLLYSLVKKHGKKKGIALYAGGYVNPKSIRYAKRAIKLETKIKNTLPDKFPISLPKELLFWLWRVIE